LGEPVGRGLGLGSSAWPCESASKTTKQPRSGSIAILAGEPTGSSAEVAEDALGHHGVGDEGNEPEPAAAGADQDVQGEDLPEEVGGKKGKGRDPTGFPGSPGLSTGGV